MISTTLFHKEMAQNMTCINANMPTPYFATRYSNFQCNLKLYPIRLTCVLIHINDRVCRTKMEILCNTPSLVSPTFRLRLDTDHTAVKLQLQ